MEEEEDKKEDMKEEKEKECRKGGGSLRQIHSDPWRESKVVE